MALLTALQGGFGDSADALRIDGRAFSREDVLGAATAVADRVAGAPALAVLARPSVETVTAVVGGLLAGVPVVPLPPDSGPKEREHILRDSGAALLAHALGDSAVGEAAVAGAAGGVEALPVDPAVRSATTYAEPAGDATGFVLYTSGTTGAPKGAVIRREAVAADLDALAAAWQWTAGDTLVHGLPLFHVHGLLLGVLGALRTGSRLVHTGRPTPAGYAAAGGSLYFGVPTVWSRLAADPEAASALAGARLLVSGSAPLPVPVFERLAELTGHAPIERYGMTESLITVSTRADGERRPGSVGLPLDGVRTRLVGEDGAPVPCDGESVGELQVAGPTLFSGYLNRPDADAESWTADGWFRTGDVGYFDADGDLHLVDRAGDLIIVNGFNVYPSEVEQVLAELPGVVEAAAVGVPDPRTGEAVKVVLVLAAGAEVTEADVVDHCAVRLAKFKVPTAVEFADVLPHSPTGKIARRRLRAG